MEQLQEIGYLAQRLNIPVKNAYNLIENQTIASPVIVRVGRKIRINVLELESWILNGGFFLNHAGKHAKKETTEDAIGGEDG